MWPSLPFLYLFLHGYTYQLLLGLAPARGGRSAAAAAGPQAGGRPPRTTVEPLAGVNPLA